jgi:CubicO group peptidase (beta-lactamase class C family)
MSSQAESVAVRRPPRRWLRRLVAVAAGVVVLVPAAYGWAWLSLDRSSIARAMIWMDADVGDQQRFPARSIPASGDASTLREAAEITIDAVPVAAARKTAGFDHFLRGTETHAFLVVHEDRLVYERYFGASDRQTLETSFSVAKSFVSTLVGIAIDEGLIGSIEDPVTRYLPELVDRDPRFERITIRRLLTMSSGLRYEEQELPLPWGDDVETYLRHGPSRPGPNQDRDRATAGVLAVQQLQPPSAGDGARARD